MRPGLIIRALGIDDLREVYLLGESFYGEKAQEAGWDPDTLADILSRELDLSFVALKKKKIIGFIIGRMIGPETAEITHLALAPEYQCNTGALAPENIIIAKSGEKPDALAPAESPSTESCGKFGALAPANDISVKSGANPLALTPDHTEFHKHPAPKLISAFLKSSATRGAVRIRYHSHGSDPLLQDIF